MLKSSSSNISKKSILKQKNIRTDRLVPIDLLLASVRGSDGQIVVDPHFVAARTVYAHEYTINI